MNRNSSPVSDGTLRVVFMTIVIVAIYYNHYGSEGDPIQLVKILGSIVLSVEMILSFMKVQNRVNIVFRVLWGICTLYALAFFYTVVTNATMGNIWPKFEKGAITANIAAVAPVFAITIALGTILGVIVVTSKGGGDGSE